MSRLNEQVIAFGYLPQNAGVGGTQIQSVRGCDAISGGTGLRQITLPAKYVGLSDADVVISYNLGFATATGDASIDASALSAGVFLINTRRAGVLTDLNSYFRVVLMPRDI